MSSYSNLPPGSSLFQQNQQQLTVPSTQLKIDPFLPESQRPLSIATPSLVIPAKPYSGGAISSNSSSSTVNNPLAINNANGAAKNYRFEYYHVLNPTLNEFRWHLNDEIFQLQQVW